MREIVEDTRPPRAKTTQVQCVKESGLLLGLLLLFLLLLLPTLPRFVRVRIVWIRYNFLRNPISDDGNQSEKINYEPQSLAYDMELRQVGHVGWKLDPRDGTRRKQGWKSRAGRDRILAMLPRIF